jgi:hypothetical protein
MPGQQSLIVRAPDDGVGVLVVTNDNGFGSAVARIIGWRCLEDLLGLESSVDDWEGRYITLKKGGGSKTEPVDPNPAPEDEEILGKYSHPGYGLLDLAHLDREDKKENLLIRQTTEFPPS